MKSFKAHLAEAGPKLKADSFKTIRAQDKKNVPDGHDVKHKAIAKTKKPLTSTQRSMAAIRKRPANEEAEEVTELSKKTLGSYAKKASDDAAYHSAKDIGKSTQALYSKSGDAKKLHKDANKSFNKALKRRSGVIRAIDKLSK